MDKRRLLCSRPERGGATGIVEWRVVLLIPASLAIALCLALVVLLVSLQRGGMMGSLRLGECT